MQLPETPGVMPLQPQTGCGFEGWRGGGRLAGGGPAVFPVASKKETKWEVECAGCQRAGRPHRAPPPSLEAHSRPESSLLAAAGPSGPAPASRAGTGKRSPLAASGEVRENSGTRGFRDLGDRLAGVSRCPQAVRPGRVRLPRLERARQGAPPGVAARTWARTAPLRGYCAPCGEFTGAAEAVGLRSQRRGMEPGSARPRAPCPERWLVGRGGALAALPLAVQPVLPPWRGERGAHCPLRPGPARPPRRRRAGTGLGSRRSPVCRAPPSGPAQSPWGPRALGAACRVFTAAASGDQPPDLRPSLGYGGKTASSFAFPDFPPPLLFNTLTRNSARMRLLFLNRVSCFYFVFLLSTSLEI